MERAAAFGQTSSQSSLIPDDDKVSCDTRLDSKSRENVCNPPLLVPKTTPVRSPARLHELRAASRVASRAVRRAKAATGSRETSASTSGDSHGAPANDSLPVHSGAVSQRVADLPASSDAHVDSRLEPSGVQRPRPVITTRGGEEVGIESKRVSIVTEIRSRAPTGAANGVDGSAEQREDDDTLNHVQPTRFFYVGRQRHRCRIGLSQRERNPFRSTR